MNALAEFMAAARTAVVPLGDGRQRSLEHFELRLLAAVAAAVLAGDRRCAELTLDDIANLLDPALNLHTAFRVLDTLAASSVLEVRSEVAGRFGVCLPEPAIATTEPEVHR